MTFRNIALKAKAVLQSLFLLLYPAKCRVESRIDENELFTHLLEADKAQPPMNLPDGSQFNTGPHPSRIRARLSSLVLRLRTNPPIALALLLGAVILTTVFTAVHESATIVLATLPIVMIDEALRNSGLPVKFQNAVRMTFVNDDGSVTSTFSETNLSESVDYARAKARAAGHYVAPKTSPGLPLRTTLTAQAGLDELDKIQLGVDGFFLSKSLQPLTAQESREMLKGIPAYRSFKAAYIDYTGDKDVTGEKRKSTRFAASLQTGDWANVVANAMNKRLVRDYGMLGLNAWRSFVDIVPVTDFKAQDRVRYGGYGNLPTVAEGHPYLPMSSPGDEHATYTPAKKGGTEDLTLELIKNDDAGAVQKIPQRLVRAAGQTIHEFVFDFVKPVLTTESVGTPVVTYDGTALYTTAHANKGTAALAADAVAFLAAEGRLLNQKEKDNAKPLGIRAGFLLVPNALRAIAYGLTTNAYGQANIVPAYQQQLNVQPIVVSYWTDGTDWVLIGRREDGLGIEIGFLDGKEDPEIIVSDLANVGSWFTNDKITYKIRHIYGGAITDFRFFDGSIVSG